MRSLRTWSSILLVLLTMTVMLVPSLGSAAGTDPGLEARVSRTAPAQTIAAGGSDFLCGIRADLTITCWGRDALGLPAPPDGRYAAVAAGRRDVCALAIDASMVCWGRWYAGGAPLGQPVVAPPGRFLSVDVADTQACAIRTDQTLTCWGAWQSGESRAADMPPSGRFVDVAAVHDWQGGCAIRVEGTIACWGPDSRGEATPPSGTFREIDSGRQMYCAIRAGGATDGTLACWGWRLYGMDEPPAGRYTTLAIGGDTGCAIGEDRSVSCWGAAIGGAPSASTDTAAVTVGETIAATVADVGAVDAWGETRFWNVWGVQGPAPSTRFATHHVLSDRPDV